MLEWAGYDMPSCFTHLTDACECRYSLNALVDFPVSDPIEIIKRLMIGSEGTLGFVSRATYNTVPEWPNKVCVIASDASKLPRDC